MKRCVKGQHHRGMNGIIESVTQCLLWHLYGHSVVVRYISSGQSVDKKKEKKEEGALSLSCYRQMMANLANNRKLFFYYTREEEPFPLLEIFTRKHIFKFVKMFATCKIKKAHLLSLQCIIIFAGVLFFKKQGKNAVSTHPSRYGDFLSRSQSLNVHHHDPYQRLGHFGGGALSVIEVF